LSLVTTRLSLKKIEHAGWAVCGWVTGSWRVAIFKWAVVTRVSSTLGWWVLVYIDFRSNPILSVLQSDLGLPLYLWEVTDVFCG